MVFCPNSLRTGSLLMDTASLQLGFIRSSGVKSGDNEANKVRRIDYIKSPLHFAIMA